MKKIFLPVVIFLFFNDCYAQQLFQLAPPMLNYGSAFFSGYVIASLKFAQPGTQIFLTLNNKEPTENDAAYQNPIVINKNLTTLKAKVFGNGYLPSETVQVTFIKDGLKIKSIEQPAANERFPGNGAQTLYDNEGGIADLHNKNFLGYQQDSVEIDVALEKEEKVKSVLIDFLQDHGSWIFLPQSIRVFYFNEKSKTYDLMEQKKIPPSAIAMGSSNVFEILKPGKKIKTGKIKIILEPLQNIPHGHPAAGKQAWLFIDEIKIY